MITTDDVAELRAAFRSPATPPTAPNPDSAHQADVHAIANDLRRLVDGRSVDQKRTRRIVRASLSDELRRIGLIAYGARVASGSDLDHLLDEMTAWVLHTTNDVETAR